VECFRDELPPIDSHHSDLLYEKRREGIHVLVSYSH